MPDPPEFDIETINKGIILGRDLVVERVTEQPTQEMLDIVSEGIATVLENEVVSSVEGRISEDDGATWTPVGLGQPRVTWTINDLSLYVDSIQNGSYLATTENPLEVAATMNMPFDDIPRPDEIVEWRRGSPPEARNNEESIMPPDNDPYACIWHGGVAILRPDGFNSIVWNQMWSLFHTSMLLIYDTAMSMPNYDATGAINNIIAEMNPPHGLSESRITFIQDWVETMWGIRAQNEAYRAPVGVRRSATMPFEDIDFTEPTPEVLVRDRAGNEFRYSGGNWQAWNAALDQGHFPPEIYSAPRYIIGNTRLWNAWMDLWHNYPNVMSTLYNHMNNFHGNSSTYLDFFESRDQIINHSSFSEGQVEVLWRWIYEYLLVRENLNTIPIAHRNTIAAITGIQEGEMPSIAPIVNHLHELGATGGRGNLDATGGGFGSDIPVVIPDEHDVWNILWDEHYAMMETIQFILDDCTTDYRETDFSKRLIKLNIEMKQRVRNVLIEMPELDPVESSYIWKWVNELIDYASKVGEPTPYRKLGPGIENCEEEPKQERKKLPYAVLTPRMS